MLLLYAKQMLYLSTVSHFRVSDNFSFQPTLYQRNFLFDTFKLFLDYISPRPKFLSALMLTVAVFVLTVSILLLKYSPMIF